MENDLLTMPWVDIGNGRVWIGGEDDPDTEKEEDPDIRIEDGVVTDWGIETEADKENESDKENK